MAIRFSVFNYKTAYPARHETMQGGHIIAADLTALTTLTVTRHNCEFSRVFPRLFSLSVLEAYIQPSSVSFVYSLHEVMRGAAEVFVQKGQGTDW